MQLEGKQVFITWRRREESVTWRGPEIRKCWWCLVTSYKLVV